MTTKLVRWGLRLLVAVTVSFLAGCRMFTFG